MIHGAHVLIQSKDAAADLAFLADVLGQPPAVDAGGGWMIYALPPAEIAVHPSEHNDVHSLYLMCDDIGAFVGKMRALGAPCSEVSVQRWGKLVNVTLPGGGRVGVYEPTHPSPKPRAASKAPAKRKTSARKGGAKRAVKKAAKPGKKKVTKGGRRR